jgi:(p)ppGpp synthase/HD superfamily hydrolase
MVNGRDDVTKARAFAIEAHGEQRYGDEPYVYHLDAVAKLVEPYGEAAQVVAYLHDVVEDTAVDVDRIRQEFGEHAARCVLLVTDEAAVNRKERKAKTNAKLSKVEGDERVALIVKAADRLANLRMSVRGGGMSKLEMYRGEQTEFRKAAWREGLCDEIWGEIEEILGRLG